MSLFASQPSCFFSASEDPAVVELETEEMKRFVQLRSCCTPRLHAL